MFVYCFNIHLNKVSVIAVIFIVYFGFRQFILSLYLNVPINANYFFVYPVELLINVYREGVYSGTASSSYGTPSEDFHSGTPALPLAIGQLSPSTAHLQNVNRSSLSNAKCIEIVVTQLEAGVIQRTFDLKVSLK